MFYRKIVKKIKEYSANLEYIKYYKSLDVVPKTVLLEASHGNAVYGNIFYIIKELCTKPEYSDFRIYLSVNRTKLKFAEKVLKQFDNGNLELVEIKSRKYYQLAASVEFLVNDTSFLPFFTKKQDQKYLNVWHGTPLKTLGKKVEGESHLIGNVQKNFIIADYLLYPNEYTKNHMIEDYMIENLSNAEIILNGYPRNTVFFDDESRKKTVKKYSLDGKKVYVYMPTWRGETGNIDKKNNEIKSYLKEIEALLEENEYFYVKLHPFIGKNIDLGEYIHVKPMPEDCETYEFLNAADCLITDYSSVFYDFAVTRKKIVLFTYDEKVYLKGRGLYEPLDSLPFDKVYDVKNLMKAIRSDKGYDDKNFIDKYCSYESYDAAEHLCEHVFLGEKNNIVRQDMPSNGKENILIYAGKFARNGITAALFNLLNEVDTDKYNYFLTFRDSKVEDNKRELHNIPHGIDYIVIKGRMNIGIKEKAAHILYKKRRMKFDKYWSIIGPAYYQENKRTYGNAKFKTVIHFTGYDYKWILRMLAFDCNRVIYAHSDVNNEIVMKNNLRKEILEYAYKKYDKIAVVTKDLIEATSKLVKDKSKIKVAKNIINYEVILKKSLMPINFDAETICNVKLEKLKKELAGDKKVFLNVGRYSSEKGHERLVNIFDKLYSENSDIYLIIIGGYQRNTEYNDLVKYVGNLKCKNNVALILSMTNPYSVMRMCDYFVLSSFYEGFGLVLAEANILGLPVISTDIKGPKGFMEQNGGMLVENSNEGLYEGMKSLLNDEVSVMNIDYESYNREAIAEFEKLLN